MSRKFVPITQEIVELLRTQGADADLIEFTERHVTRYSRADLERAQGRAALWTLGAVGLFGLLLLWLVHP